MMQSEQSRSELKRLWPVAAVLLASWAMFSSGYLWLRQSTEPLAWWKALVLALTPIATVSLAGVIWIRRGAWLPWITHQLEIHTRSIESLSGQRVGLWIALAAGLGLYAELMIIRLNGSFFQLFAYFKNVSLLSCFLGLGIGYLLGARVLLTTPLVLPLLAVQSGFMHFLHSKRIAFALQNPISEQVAFGVDQAETIAHVVMVYGFLSLVFAFNALAFIPLGQLASRLMMRQPKLVAYAWNLIGSLLGIALFYSLAFLWAPPMVWLVPLVVGLMLFLRGDFHNLAPTAGSAFLLLAFLAAPVQTNEITVYSPYQVMSMTVQRGSPPLLRVNNVYHQRILDLRDAQAMDDDLTQWASHYALPYHFVSQPESVLVLGSGTGNDVAAALRHNAGNVDAVEIDPAILEFGKSMHPESPYQAASVEAIVGDARAFIRHTDKKYDLIVYGLVDSHTLLSGMSGVRLDSYIYTVEAFREARARLREGGLITMTFSLLKPELGHKLYLMLEEAFDGQTPAVYTTGYDEGRAFIIGDSMSERQRNLPAGILDVTEEFARAEVSVDMSTDDWPFFYMPERRYPISYLAMITVLMAISWAFVRQFAPSGAGGISLPCFFLGAGFMLVETKAITEIALELGSTWVVIGAVIASILVMAFFANLMVLRAGTPRTIVSYGLLFISLIVGMYLSGTNLDLSSPLLTRVVLTLLLTVPLFFSGFAFSAELKRSASVATALSSNLLGAMLGGFLEYNSMYFGFRSLYLIGLAMYFFAFLASVRVRSLFPVAGRA